MLIINKFRNITVLFISIALISCGEQPNPIVKSPLVETYRLPERNKSNITKFPAVVSASDLSELSFRVSGELIELPAKSGQKVKKGDIIAKLDPTNFQLDLSDKKAKMDLAKVSMDRTKAMVDFGNMAQSVFDEFEAEYRVAKAKYELSMLRLSYVNLKVPFDGVLATVPADNFQSVARGELIATIHRTDKIEIKVDLPDAILAVADTTNDSRSKVVVDVTLDAYPEHVFKSYYKEHTTEQNQDNKSFELTLEMSQDLERTALQGMPGSVDIDMNNLKVTSTNYRKIPIEAVTLPDFYPSSSSERIIWRIKEDNTVEPVKVTTSGMADIDHIYVSGDFNSGDEIIVKGMFYLKDGLSVSRVSQGDNL